MILIVLTGFMQSAIPSPLGEDNGNRQDTAYLLGIRSSWLDWNRIANGRWDIPLSAGEERGRYIIASLTAPPASCRFANLLQNV